MTPPLRIGCAGFAWALVLVPALVAGGAHAHTRSQSFSSWRVGGARVEGTFTILAREVTRLPEAASGLPLGTLYARHLAETVQLVRGGEPCRADGEPRALRARPGHVRVLLRFVCSPSGALVLESHALLDQAPSHVHFARVSGLESGPVEHLLTAARPVAVLGGGQPGETHAAGFGSYLRLGVEHILAGADHVAFLVALLLLGGRLRDVLLVVTGFTLGHSLTLSLAVLGWVRVDAGVVEALIGFSIALVAAENLGVASHLGVRLARAGGAALGALALLSAWRGAGPPALALAGLALFTACYLPLARTPAESLRHRPAVTTLFGLVHGFGFAAVLQEIGLPPGRVAVGLLGFNLGVELGQLALVVACLVAAGVLRRAARARDLSWAADGASAALLALGLFWFASRGWS